MMPGLNETAQGTKPGDLSGAPTGQAPAPEAQPAATPAADQSAAQPAQPDPAAAQQAQPAAQDPHSLAGMTPDQIDGYKKYLSTQGLSPDQADKYVQYLGGPPPEESTGKKILHGAASALDYAGGLTRTGVYSAISVLKNAAQGELKDDVTPNDIKSALQGKAPSSNDYLQRLGVPELGSMDIPLFGKTSGRGIAGFVSDITMDPIVALTTMAKDVPYIGKIINAPGALADKIGESVYKQAVGKIDAKVASRAGLDSATPVADALIANGAPVGSTSALAKKVDQIADTMGTARKTIYDDAKAKGIMADMGKAEFPEADKIITRLRDNPTTGPIADALQEMIDKFKSSGPVDLEKLSQWKTDLYNAVPDSAWTKGGASLRVPAQQFKKALSNDFKNLIVDSGNAGEKGMGDAIDAINSKWGPLLDAKDPMFKAAKSSGASGLGQQIDHTMLSLNHLPSYAVKKALDLATTSTGRTAIGKAIMKYGSTGFANATASRAIQGAVTPNQGEDGQ